MNYKYYHEKKNIDEYLMYLLKDSTRVLKLGAGGMERFPAMVLEFKHLNILNMRGNHLESLASEINSLPLERFNIQDNKFTTFPVEVCNITTLKDLDVSGNNIQSIPSKINSLKFLERLDLFWKKIQDLRVEMNIKGEKILLE